jgi:hypothetical protein
MQNPTHDGARSEVDRAEAAIRELTARLRRAAPAAWYVRLWRRLFYAHRSHAQVAEARTARSHVRG